MKNDYKSTLKLFCAINCFKNTLYSKNDNFFENRQNWSQCRGYSLCEMLKIVQNESSIKRVKSDCKSTLESFCAKNGFKKHLILKTF